MSTIIRPQLRAILYRLIPGLGGAGSAESVSATAITDPFVFGHGEGSNKWKRHFLYRPTLTGYDRIKTAGALSGAALSIESTEDYVDQTTLPYEWTGPLTPDELNQLISEALKDVPFSTRVPVGIWTDHDMSAATAAAFTGQDSGATSTKGTTAGTEVESGIRGLIVTNSGANGRTRTNTVNVTPGDRLYHGAINRVNAAGQTAIYRLWDITNNVELGTAIQHSELAWQHIRRADTIPTGCHQIAAQLEGAGASDVIHWDALPSHFLTSARIVPSAWVNAPWKLVDVEIARYNRTVATGRDLAASRSWEAWRRPTDYTLEDFHQQATPYVIQVHGDNLDDALAKIPEADLWLHGKRPYFDISPLTDESTALTMPQEDQDMLVWACKRQISRVLKYRVANNARWVALEQEAEEHLNAARIVRTDEPEPPQRVDQSWGLR